MKKFLFGIVIVAAQCLCSGPATGQSPSEDLHAIFEREWEYLLREDPVYASWLGDRRYNNRWQDISLSAIQKRHEHDKQVLEELKQFDVSPLSPQDRLNHALAVREYENAIERYRFGWYLLPINQRDGIQTQDDLADALRFTTIKDYEDWLARLESFPEYMDQTIALLNEGIRKGMVHPKIILERIPDQVKKQLVKDPANSPFFKKFREIPVDFSPEDRNRLITSASVAIETKVIPSYQKLYDFVSTDYLKAGYDRVGAWQMPQGKEMYAFLTRDFTTTELTPEEVHRIGLEEVERIRAEMQVVIQKTNFQGSFSEFLEFLRTDPQFYFEDPQELLEASRALCKRLDPHLVKLFGKLPRTPYGVEPIPANIAPDTTTAYYRPPAADGSRAGTYFVNLFRPEVRPKYEMEALSLHEAIPGHHLQIALAMELENLPKFRRYGGYTAFIEGWGLYSERLGDEMDCYKDPFSKFGQLTYEMWRAVRLVVDTGMHHHGWTRDKAIDFFKANAAKTEHDIVNEIDRYIAWPGQALAYKIGELKIRQLRELSRKQLGDSFDIREFHDLVLGSGAVPLNILESNVNAWLETKSPKEVSTSAQ